MTERSDHDDPDVEAEEAFEDPWMREPGDPDRAGQGGEFIDLVENPPGEAEATSDSLPTHGENHLDKEQNPYLGQRDPDADGADGADGATPR